MRTSGHIPGTALRGHSVADPYPFMVVGLGNPHNGSFRWSVQWPGNNGMSSLSWRTAQEAENYANSLKKLHYPD